MSTGGRQEEENESPSASIEHFLRQSCQLDAPWVERYGRCFASNFIRPSELSDLSHELLKEMGVEAVGHRIRILKAIREHPTLFQEEIIPGAVRFPQFGEQSPPRAPSAPRPALSSPTRDYIALDSPSEDEVDIKPIPSLPPTAPVTTGEEDDLFDDDREDQLLSLAPRHIKEEDFEGLVSTDNIVSSRPSGHTLAPFTTLPSEENFVPLLCQTIQKAFRLCQLYPRSHQLQALEQLLGDVMRKHVFGKVQSPREPLNYLLQHSMGSGKSLVLACLVYFLSTIRQRGERLFDVIVVMNDRKQLDMQLWMTVSRFLSAHGVAIDPRSRPSSSEELAHLLLTQSKGTSRTNPLLVFSTLQKFIRIGSMDLSSGSRPFPTCRIAILADEAHRSHGHRGSRLLHDFMTGQTRQQMNITYFSFTSTPTVQSLEMFGSTRHANLKEPFHTYAISEAIDDGHILNPLINYTTVATRATFQENPEDNDFEGAERTFETNFQQSVAQLTRAAASHKEILRSRAHYIIQHFTEEILSKRTNERFAPKAMLVASSRLAILRYKEILEDEIARLPSSQQFEVVCAFTPFVHQEKTFYEEEVNSTYGMRALQAFQEPTSRVKMIIVHSKFLIGFDEPLLHTMYIDRRLYGTTLVQALGRLCRIAPGKQDTCVVDFVNPRKTVADVFGLYWNKTTVRSFRNFDSDKQKFRRVVEKLSLYDCLVKKREPAVCMEYFRKEQVLNPQILKEVSRLITKYFRLADALQTESPNLHITKLRKLKQLVADALAPSQPEVVEEAKKRLQVHVAEVSTVESGTIVPREGKTHKPHYGPTSSRTGGSTTKSVPTTARDLIRTVGENYHRQQGQLQTRDASALVIPPPAPTLTQPVTGMSEMTMEFAKNLLRRTGERQKQGEENGEEGDDEGKEAPMESSSPILPSPSPLADDPSPLHSSTELNRSGGGEPQSPRISLKLVPRVVEISKAFQLLESEDEDEIAEGLHLLQKHVEFADNKIALQNKNLIPQVLNILKKQEATAPHEAQFLTALQILTSFCDCTNDVDKCVNLGIFGQLTRLLQVPRSNHQVVACCKLLQCILGIGSEALVSKVSKTELIPALDQVLSGKEYTVETKQEVVRILAVLGENMLCLQKMHQVDTVVLLLDMLISAEGPMAVLLGDTLTRFAKNNQSIRNCTRNASRRRVELCHVLDDCDVVKYEAVRKFVHYIWGNVASKKRRTSSRGPSRGKPSSSPRPTGTPRSRSPRRGDGGPPPKRPRVDAALLYAAQHTISYGETPSGRLRPPSASPASTTNAFDYSPAARLQANRGGPYWKRN